MKDRLKQAAIGGFYGLAIIAIPYFLLDLFRPLFRMAVCG